MSTSVVTAPQYRNPNKCHHENTKVGKHAGLHAARLESMAGLALALHDARAKEMLLPMVNAKESEM